MDDQEENVNNETRGTGLDCENRHVKYYFFRDIDKYGNCQKPTSPNMGCYEQDAGIVLERYSKNSGSGKDIVVGNVHPFKGTVEHQWRGDDEVELFEVDEWEWKSLRDQLEKIESLNQT